MNEAICSAIAGRNCLLLYCDGGYRVVEPHCCGISADGRNILLAFQIEGFSRSGATQAWKLFVVTEIQELQKLDATFPGPRPGFNPEDSVIAQVCIRL